MPLQQPLRIRKRTVLLGARGGGNEEDLCTDRLRIGALRPLVPEGCCVNLEPVTYHEPLQLLQTFAREMRVRSACRRILTEEEHPFDLAFRHANAARRMR